MLQIERPKGRVVFVSGHLDLTQDEFQQHYAPKLHEAAEAGCAFVVGDAPGCDMMTQLWLLGYSKIVQFQRHQSLMPGFVTVYHMLERPRNYAGLGHLRGGFSNDEDRDAAMTAASDTDIAWVRPTGSKKHSSGTAKNLRRRDSVRHEQDREARKHYPRFSVEDDYYEEPVLRVDPEPVVLGEGDSRDYERAVPIPVEVMGRLAAARQRVHAAERDLEAVMSEVRLWRSRQEADPV